MSRGLAWKRPLLVHARRLRLLVVAAWALAFAGALLGWWRLKPAAVYGLVFFSVAVLVLHVWARWQREVAVREAPLPQLLKRRLREAHPQLGGRDGDLVERGLRQFFLACLRSAPRHVTMPSRVVGEMWLEFTRQPQLYADWCRLTLGHVLPHSQAQALGTQVDANDGLRRAWYWACRDESIDPRRASRLPLLFALDTKLGIAGGFRYTADEQRLRAGSPERSTTGDSSSSSAHDRDSSFDERPYSARDFTSSSYGGDVDRLGGAESSDGGGFGDGGSDGGGGGDSGGGGGD